MKPSPTLPTNLPTTQELSSDVLSLADGRKIDPSLPTPPAIGHNQPAFDDVVAENLRRGLYLTQRDVLINSLRDARLSHRHRLALASIIEHTNSRDGMAYPGRRALAQGTVWYDHDWNERHYTEPGIAKTISELIDFGYLVFSKRAPEGGKRALAHYTIVKRTTEELQAEISSAIERIRREARSDAADVTLVGNVTHGGNVTPGGKYRKADVTPAVSADVTPVVPTVTSIGTRRERDADTSDSPLPVMQPPEDCTPGDAVSHTRPASSGPQADTPHFNGAGFVISEGHRIVIPHEIVERWQADYPHLPKLEVKLKKLGDQILKKGPNHPGWSSAAPWIEDILATDNKRAEQEAKVAEAKLSKANGGLPAARRIFTR